MKFILSIAVLASMLAGTAALACNKNSYQGALVGNSSSGQVQTPPKGPAGGASQ